MHTPKNVRFDLTKYGDINRSLVMVPTGENRLPFLTLKSNHNGDVVELIKKHFQDDFIVIPSKEAIEKGLFGKGKLHPNLEDRVGDLSFNSARKCLSVVVAKRKSITRPPWGSFSGRNVDSFSRLKTLIFPT